MNEKAAAAGTALEPASALHSSLADVETLLHNPRFFEAARLYVQLNLEACENDARIRQVFGNAARHVAFSLIATLSARAELAQGPPPIQSRVIETIEGMGLSSHGKIEALIKRMTDHGMIVRTPHAKDNRTRVMTPTEAFLAMDDVLCGIHARPVALLIDDPIVAGVAAGDRATTRRMRAAGLPLIEGGGAMLARNPLMLHFLMFDAGWLILFSLMDAVWSGDPRAQRSAAIARLCGVSRPHVRNVLSHGHMQGFLEEIAPGMYAPTAAFFDVAHVWIAECLAAFARCCRLAQTADLSPVVEAAHRSR
ncbi:MAG: hypothetical protein K2X34_05285 [Hyphomonadaceae bacterium]|nr:hypothetical protein [Hyphomonadaceae bacterium]MBY0423246.1 hypothetical protein [Parvularculaceae bacterium]